jgi:6-phosphogluconolactonase (cycloisomerase 2 family)
MPADKKRLGEQMSKKLRAILAFAVLAGLSLLLLNCGTSTSRPAGVLYVLSQGESTVGSYAINLDSGALSLINSTAKTDSTPVSILLDASGKVAFVLNQGSSTITSYTLNSDGTLTAASGSVSVPSGSVAMARDAAGTFLFVVSQSTPSISVFSMQSGSTSLTPVETDPLTYVPTAVASGTGASGALLYVTGNQDLVGTNDNTVNEYSVDGTGHITFPALLGSPYTVGSDPGAVVAVKTTPVGGSGGLFVYVANSGNGSGGNSLNVFSVCTVTSATCTTDDVTNATLLPVGGAVSVGLAPVAMTVDPTNAFLFVVNYGSNTVSGFKINGATGALSPLNPATASTGFGPISVSMHPSGKFLFVSNNGSSNVSGFNVDTTSGKMSTAINVTSAAQPAGVVAK